MTPVATVESPHPADHEVRAGRRAAAVPSLTDQELAALHGEDAHAARIIITIMGGIFTIGVIIYLVICLSAVGN